jgi:hypothetical protein
MQENGGSTLADFKKYLTTSTACEPQMAVQSAFFIPTGQPTLKNVQKIYCQIGSNFLRT